MNRQRRDLITGIWVLVFLILCVLLMLMSVIARCR